MSELIKVEDYQPAVLFGSADQVDAVLKELDKIASAEVFDMSTAKGRDGIRSMAAKVAKSKTALDNMGKAHVAELKALPKLIDEQRRRFREGADEIRDRVRLPLTQYEEAQKAREQAYTDFCGECTEHSSPEYGATLDDLLELEKRLNAKDAATLAEEFQAPAATALQAAKDKLTPMIEQAKAVAKAEAEQAEAARIAAEAQAKAEAERRAREQAEARRLAEENAKMQAEREAEAKRIAAENAAREKREAKERAEREKAEAEAKKKADALEAERQKAIAEAETKQKAAEAEAERIAKQAADEKAELAKAEAMAKAREEDQEHRRAINAVAAKAVSDAAGLDEKQAQAVIKAIALGQVPSVSIKY